MYYTGIGSRKETPNDVLGIMEDAAYRLARVGGILRSGKAEGADSAFQKGVQRYVKDYRSANIAEIYTPWDKFITPGLSSDWDISLNHIDLVLPDQISYRDELVKEIHPAAEWLKENRMGSYAMHSRNVHQIMGMNLREPRLSKFVLYFAPESKKGTPKGGTATAVKLAQKFGVRCLNLDNIDNWIILEKFLESLEVKRGLRT